MSLPPSATAQPAKASVPHAFASKSLRVALSIRIVIVITIELTTSNYMATQGMPSKRSDIRQQQRSLTVCPAPSTKGHKDTYHLITAPPLWLLGAAVTQMALTPIRSRQPRSRPLARSNSIGG